MGRQIEQTKKILANVPKYDETNDEFMQRVYGHRQKEKEKEGQVVEKSFWKRMNAEKKKKKKKKMKKENVVHSHIALSKFDDESSDDDFDDDELEKALAAWAKQ